MRRIFKYVLSKEEETIALPMVFKLMKTGDQRGEKVAWLSVDPDSPPELWTKIWVPTGGELPEGAHYLGTWQNQAENFVLHLFLRPA